MNKLKLILILITLSVISVACSDKDKEEQAIQDDIYQSYQTHLQTTIDRSNELLSIFNVSLDGIYTGSTSNSQFGNILKNKIIDESRSLVDEIEIFVANPALFEVNRQLVSHINKQHQLFLDAVSMANEDMVTKDVLKESYLLIKDEQATIINNWLSDNIPE